MKVKIISLLAAFFVLCSINAYGNGVSTSSTRLVFHSNDRVIPYSVFNTDNHTYLIQAWIENSQGVKTKDFIVTPPLFKMAPNTENGLRILYTAVNVLPKDRESLFFLNVKAIPGMTEQQASSKNYLQLALKMRMKLFYRPENLAIKVQDVPTKLIISKVDNKTIIANNPTPYYVTIVKIEDAKTHKFLADVSQNMLKPFSQQKLTIKHLESVQSVLLFIVDDYGGINTKEFSLAH